MVEWFARSRPGAGRLLWLLAALLFPFIAFAEPAAAEDSFAGPAAADQSIVVSIDQSTIINLPDSTKTIVLGNPLVADITMLRNSGGNLIIVVIGKGYGRTNLVAFDSKGIELTNKIVMVTGPVAYRGVDHENTAVVQRGTERETYSCMPVCYPQLTLGDSADFFSKTMAQIKDNSTSAQASGGQTAGQQH